MVMPTNPYGTAPQLPDWLQQVQPLNSMPSTAPALNLPTTFRKSGMFGSGYSFGQALSDGLNGYLAGMGNPVGRANIEAIHQQRMLQQQQALADTQYQRDRQDKLADFKEQYQYELDHPKPANNDTVADYNFWKGVLPPDQFQQYVQNKVNPPVMQYVPGIGLIQTRGGGSNAPTSPVGKLTPIDGGQPGAPAGNFPGY